MTVTFQLNGQEFIALNGGPQFSFSPAISFIMNCEMQEEIDELWEKLSAGGEKEVCGWLKDKYGVSWQLVSAVLGEMIRDKDSEKTGRVMKALQMTKRHSDFQQTYVIISPVPAAKLDLVMTLDKSLGKVPKSKSLPVAAVHLFHL
jgi:hypothetical protein